MAIAHNEVPDSIATHELDEIVVQAPRIIRKADMDVFYPSQTAVEYSKNGMQMLRNLMIPTLNVDDFPVLSSHRGKVCSCVLTVE